MASSAESICGDIMICMMYAASKIVKFEDNHDVLLNIVNAIVLYVQEF
jgi:hypothetical protein